MFCSIREPERPSQKRTLFLRANHKQRLNPTKRGGFEPGGNRMGHATQPEIQDTAGQNSARGTQIPHSTLSNTLF